jgi:hypothetical protein
MVDVWGMGGIRIWDGNSFTFSGASRIHQVPVALQAGKVPSRKLQELRGTLTAVVRTAPQLLFAINAPEQAVGKVVSGDRGGTIQVEELRRGPDGSPTLKVNLRGIEGVAEDGPGEPIQAIPPVPWVGVRGIRGARIINPGPPNRMANEMFLLKDDQGNLLELEPNDKDGGISTSSNRTVILVVRAPKAGGRIARLEYLARRSIVVEVPFVLRDVPLR